MANLASILKDEISRLARKELRQQTGVTARLVSQHRRDIADLKRQVAALTRSLRFLEAQEKRRIVKSPTASVPTTSPTGRKLRFVAAGLRAHRKRIGLTQTQYGKLVSVSALSIYNWESGNAKPRDRHLPALASVRGLGKREALKRLELTN